MHDVQVRVRVRVPQKDWAVFVSLADKYGWQVEERRQLLEDFIRSRPLVSGLTEEEIMDEVRAVRYGEDNLG